MLKGIFSAFHESSFPQWSTNLQKSQCIALVVLFIFVSSTTTNPHAFSLQRTSSVPNQLGSSQRDRLNHNQVSSINNNRTQAPGTRAVKVVPIKINNNQNTSTGQYQQRVQIDDHNFAGYVNSNWSNVEFEYQNGTSIFAWIESGSSNTSVITSIYLNLNSIPAFSSLLILMVFFPENSSLLSANGPIGEAPQLSPIWGEYDNGGLVFDLYANFQGASFPNNWSLQGSGNYSKGNITSGIVLINNEGHAEGAVVYDLPFTTENIVIQMSGMYDTGSSAGSEGIGTGFYSSGPSTDPAPANGYYAKYEWWNNPVLIYNGNAVFYSTTPMPNAGGINYLFSQTVVSASFVRMEFTTTTSGPYASAPLTSVADVIDYNGPINNSSSTFFLGGSTIGLASFLCVYWVRILTYETMMPTFSIGVNSSTSSSQPPRTTVSSITSITSTSSTVLSSSLSNSILTSSLPPESTFTGSSTGTRNVSTLESNLSTSNFFNSPPTLVDEIIIALVALFVSTLIAYSIANRHSKEIKETKNHRQQFARDTPEDSRFP